MSTWSNPKYTQVKGKTYVSHSELNEDWWTNKVHQFPTASTVWKFVWFLGTLSNLNQIFNRRDGVAICLLAQLAPHVSRGRILPLPLSNVRPSEIEVKMISVHWSWCWCQYGILLPYPSQFRVNYFLLKLQWLSYYATVVATFITIIIIIKKNQQSF